MKPWITATLLASLLMPLVAEAQVRTDDPSTTRQQRTRLDPLNTLDGQSRSRDQRRLDQLLRLREQSNLRNEQLSQPAQPSRPANSRNQGGSFVETQ